MKTLLFLTTSFPYDKGEEFILNEIPYISGFDKIVIAPIKLNDNSVRTKDVPINKENIPIEVLSKKYNSGGLLSYLKLIFKLTIWCEVFNLVRCRKLNKARLHQLLFFAKNGYAIYNGLKEVSVLKSDKATIYSYWFYDGAFAGALLAKKFKAKFISRCHRFDIYDDRHQSNYIPFRKFLLSRVDSLYPCSQNGTTYLQTNYPSYKNKIRPSFLGTEKTVECSCSNNPFNIVSCSSMIPVKRLDLLVKALALLDFPVTWTHIGDGELKKQIESIELPENITAIFKGQIANHEILDFYSKENISVFVNLSSSEGLPVSIMEAMSFGIPIIATNVGGTSEAVSDEVGILLPENPTLKEISDSFRKLYDMDKIEYKKLCQNSYKKWSKNFNCADNYKKFYKDLKN